MKRTANPQGAHKSHRRRIYYADPKHAGKSRCGKCFPSDVNPKRAAYPQTDGPCWVCQMAQQKRTLYLLVLRMADDLEDVAHSLERLCVKGFALCELIARRTAGVLKVEREKLELADGDSVLAFRGAWAEAIEKLAFRARGDDFFGELYGHFALGAVQLEPMTMADPRVWLAKGDPTVSPTVESNLIMGRIGRLAYIAEHLLKGAQELRQSLTKNHGDDSDEPLRLLRQRLGANQLGLVVSALEFLEPRGQLNDRGKEQARAISGKLRQRTFQRRPLPGE